MEVKSVMSFTQLPSTEHIDLPGVVVFLVTNTGCQKFFLPEQLTLLDLEMEMLWNNLQTDEREDDTWQYH